MHTMTFLTAYKNELKPLQKTRNEHT